MRTNGCKLVHLVQCLVGPLEVDQPPLAEELDVSAELASDAPDPFRHGADFSGRLGVEDHDPIGLCQVVTPDDDGFRRV